MKSHIMSVLVGTSVAAVGLALWLWAGDVDTPVITLSKVGVVLVVLGVLEVVVSAVAMALPSTRRPQVP